MWPHPSRTTVRAPRIDTRAGRTSRSWSPKASVTGTVIASPPWKWFWRIAVLVASYAVARAYERTMRHAAR
jgi:hypothetical protein